MADKLKIYMCSGVGDAKGAYQYWLDGTNTLSNTMAVNTLLARINALCVRLDYQAGLTPSDRIELFNQIDILVCALQFARSCKGDNNALARAGRLIQQYINDQRFDCTDTTDDARAAHLDRVYADLAAAFADGKDSTASGSFISWWREKIVSSNRCALTSAQQSAGRKAIAKRAGVGSADEEEHDIMYYIYNSGEYFLYLFIPEEDRKNLPYYLQEKIKIQQKTYDYVRRGYLATISEDEESLQQLIRANIIEQFKGSTPEAVVTKLLKKRGIGVAMTAATITVAEIISIIQLIITFVVGVLSVVFQYLGTVVQAKYAVPENINDGAPDDEDWVGATTGNNKLLLFGGIGLILYLLFRR